MAQWGKTDNAANSTIWAAAQVNKTANAANRTALYGNTTTNAFVTGTVKAQLGVDATEAANTSADTKKVAHAGWNLKTTGTGSVLSFTITNGGSGYANTDTVNVVATGGVNATATLTTNSTGGITTLVLTNAGSGFTNTSVTAAIANSTGGASAGTNAAIVANVGGRAGRTSYETLVAMGSIS